MSQATNNPQLTEEREDDGESQRPPFSVENDEKSVLSHAADPPVHSLHAHPQGEMQDLGGEDVPILRARCLGWNDGCGN